MSQLNAGEWKEVNRIVEAILLDYKSPDTTIPHKIWLVARGHRELRRLYSEAQKTIAQRDYIDNLGGDEKTGEPPTPYAESAQ